ncbi:TraR/DksA family transcriptional regulator [Desulfospira joergensenii]|uniref:TraR/DksA family transcriptional regulator n=1 Tax=Desulfospira joergensenii TaxID=53329 RepID=UPI0003B2EBE4|nr:TraR/DksA C4-type zinc finger protein [Desulfospira joergensenii]
MAVKTMYTPSQDEPYMNERQVAYFRDKLAVRKIELTDKIESTLNKMKSLKSVDADILDRSNSMMNLESEVMAFDRYIEQVKQIEKALDRIDTGNFGYCELTGSEIGLRRLEAMPFATMSIKAMELLESGQEILRPS